MSGASFRPVLSRIERAHEHAFSLDTEVKAFLETDPYEIYHEFDPDGGDNVLPPPLAESGAHLYRVKVKHEIPDRIAILTGDFLKDLRSALDYLAWQLALAHSQPPPPTTAFPIFASKKRYRRDRRRYIGGIDGEAHSIFESVQPYHAGEDAKQQPLWLLHRLANDDKHKAPNVVGSIPTGVVVQQPTGCGGEHFGLSTGIGPFEDGDIVAAVGGVAGSIDPPPIQATFDLAFGGDSVAKGQTLWGVLRAIWHTVRDTVVKFDEFFGDK